MVSHIIWGIISCSAQFKLEYLMSDQSRITTMASFQQIVRFKDESSNIFYGEVDLEGKLTVDNLVGSSLRVYSAGVPWDDGFILNGEKKTVKEVSSTSLLLFSKQHVSFRTVQPNLILTSIQKGSLSDRKMPNILVCRSQLQEARC